MDKSPIRSVVFDLDDTLLDTLWKRNLHSSRIVGIISKKTGIGERRIRAFHLGILRRERVFRKREFPEISQRWDLGAVSWLGAYRELTNPGNGEYFRLSRKISRLSGPSSRRFLETCSRDGYEREIVSEALLIHRPPFREKEGAGKLLRKLRGLCEIFILTQGHSETKEDRKEHILRKYPWLEGRFFVVGHKAKEMGGFFRKNCLDPSETVVVGDSLKADIFPALSLGATAVLILSDNKGDELSARRRKRLFVARDLADAERHILGELRRRSQVLA